MLQGQTLPVSLTAVLAVLRPCLTAPSFRTFTALVAGMVAQPGRRTVTGMLVGAGVAGVWHHSRAHSLFARARWSADQVGLALLRLVVDRLLPVGAPVVLAVDDTLFRRWGRKVAGAGWRYDGAADRPRGALKVSWGTCFVLVGILVPLPFGSRPVCLPVLARLCADPPAEPSRRSSTTGQRAARQASASKQAIAADLVAAAAAALAGRAIHVVADAWYAGTAGGAGTTRGATQQRVVWPVGVALTARLRHNAGLTAIAEPVPGAMGRPRRRGGKLGTPAHLAATATWRPARVRRYGRTDTVHIAEIRCLWYGVYRSRPVRVILVREPEGRAKTGYQLALVCTDLDTCAETLIGWYADRWGIETAIEDAKQHTGVGQAHNRTRRAVERTIPFGLIVHSVVIVWYTLHGYHPDDITARRARTPWHRDKTEPSYLDMIVKLRRTLIAARFRAGKPGQPTREEVLAVQAAWAEAAA